MIDTRLLRALALPFLAITLIGARPEVGELAPDFTVTLVDGTKVNRDDLRGHVVILNFWATWCGPCREELPTLDGYYVLTKKYGLRVYAVSMDENVDPRVMKKIFGQMNISPAKRITGPYARIKALPTNYVLDRNGHVRYAKAGAFDLDSLNATLIPLLKEPVPAPLAAPAT